jgi:DNA replication protein DnaD
LKIGYIKLHRKIQNNFLWLEERKFSRAEAWIDLIMEANHYGQTVLISGHNYYCKRAQTCKSILTWSNRWRWSRQKVKDFLILLQKEAQIIFETDTRTTTITILNYNIYQDPQDKIIKDEIKILNETLQQKSNRKATEKQQKDINNNDKKVKNVKKGFIKPSLSEVEEFVISRGYDKPLAKKAFEHYDLADWHDSNGKPVKNWKQKINTVWLKEENKPVKESRLSGL